MLAIRSHFPDSGKALAMKVKGWVIPTVLTPSAWISPILFRFIQASLRGNINLQLKSKFVPLLRKKQDTLVTNTVTGPRLRAEAKVVELQVFAPPRYSPLRLACLAALKSLSFSFSGWSHPLPSKHF